MSVLANDARLEAERRRLSPYLSRVLERAAQLALEVHADFLSVEHVIGAVLRDEDSAANQTIVFAFADPETLGLELLALSPGIMVVGSAATRPFSPRAVEALERARRWAAASGSERVEIESLGAAAASVLPVELLAALRDAGYHDVVPPEPSASDPSRPAPSLRLAEAAKLALSRATKATARANEPAIGPARIFHACLQAGPELEARIGLTAARARLVLEGAFIDRSPCRAASWARTRRCSRSCLGCPPTPAASSSWRPAITRAPPSSPSCSCVTKSLPSSSSAPPRSSPILNEDPAPAGPPARAPPGSSLRWVAELTIHWPGTIGSTMQREPWKPRS